MPGVCARDALAGAATANEVAVAARANAMVAAIVVSRRGLAVIESSIVVAREVSFRTVTVPQVHGRQRRNTTNKVRDLVGSGLGKFALQIAVPQPFRECGGMSPSAHPRVT